MGKKAFLAILSLALLGIGSLPAAAQDHYRVLDGPKDFYFGHISLVDIRNDGLDPVVLRNGAAAPEPASLNLPIGPGDTIRTSSERRVEIQFDNSSIVRLDKDSELLIETILAPSLSTSDKMSNLSLRKGRMYVMYRQYDSREMFQVLTPKAAVKLKNESVAMIGLAETGETEVRVRYGKAFLLFGPNPKALDELPVVSGQQAEVGRDERANVRIFRDETEFDAWNNRVNTDFVELHKGKTPLPKPIQRMPWAVADFAMKLGNFYGEWIYDPYFGYVWRPYYNGIYPGGAWAPYFNGRWSNYNGRMYWVSSEPWGWIPYHLGLWQWDEKKGWFWIPGSAFAPAWVDWSFYRGTFWVWKPWSMYDWGFYMNRFWFEEWYGGGQNYWAWKFNHWAYWQGSGYPGGGAPTGGTTARNTPVSLAKTPARVRFEIPFTLPNEFKAGLQNLMDALQKRDPAVVRALQAQTRQAILVDRDHLNSPDVGTHAASLQTLLDLGRALPLSDPVRMALSAPPLSPTESAAEASIAFQIHARTATPAAVLIPAYSPGVTSAPARALSASVRAMEAPPAYRRIDWNPDIRVAQRLGVEIRYSSLTNEVVCPQLNISSYRSGGLSGDSAFSAFSWAGRDSGPSSNATSSTGTSATTATSQTSSTTSTSSSNTSSAGGRIKN